LTSEQRIDAFVSLGREIAAVVNGNSEGWNIRQQQLAALTLQLHRSNAWFTPENVMRALDGISRLLDEKQLHEAEPRYALHPSKPKRIGVVMAGNIPAVGFHDFLMVLLCGHAVTAKISSDDRLLIPALAAMLVAIEPGFAERIHFSEGKLESFDAIIATGSNNSARYFEYYFKDYPKIIRKSRTSVAVLSGRETSEELRLLADDIFSFFGLGCRNVTKVYVPADYDLVALLNSTGAWEHLKDHSKYFNNYEYHRAGMLVNNLPHYDTGFLLLREDEALFSPIAVLYAERYHSLENARNTLHENADDIQCVVSQLDEIPDAIPFGEAQHPGLFDYADGVDTAAFLCSLR
jgi:hypothetical protein